MSEALLESARSGDLNALNAAIAENRGALEEKDDGGRTPLIVACRKGNADCVKALLGAKAMVNAQDVDGRTGLHWAAEKSHVDVIRALVNAKANVNVQDEEGWTPLHKACNEGDLACLELLLKAKPQLSLQTKSGYTALHFASLGHVDCLQALHAAGADVGVKNAQGKTALDLAREERRASCVHVLTGGKGAYQETEGGHDDVAPRAQISRQPDLDYDEIPISAQKPPVEDIDVEEDGGSAARSGGGGGGGGDAASKGKCCTIL